MSGNWIAQSFIAIVPLTIAWLAMPFFEKNLGVSASVFLVWYFIGSAAFVAFCGMPEGESIAPSWRIVAAIAIIGFVFGVPSNNMLFVAVAQAPNPALPVAIANITTLTTYVAAFYLAVHLPKYFKAVEMNAQTFLGAALIIAGAALVSIKDY